VTVARRLKTNPGQLKAVRDRCLSRQKVVDAAKRVRETGVPEWVNLGGARLMLGPVDDEAFPYESLLFASRGSLYAAECAARKGGNDQKALCALSGAPFKNVRINACKVLCAVLDHHPRKKRAPREVTLHPPGSR
jgi:hypothetical protein